MRRFWWVNHKQTVRQEIDGQYLWSPKTKKNGARNQFYDNMRLASPGDYVLSYAHQAIRYVGRVADFALTAPKPEEFGNIGAYWGNEGWYLPVFWTELTPPVSPKALIHTLALLLPKRYSPINPRTGAGYQSVYLAEISPEVFRTVVAGATYSDAALLHGGANSLTHEVITEMLDNAVQQRIEADLTLDETMKESLIKARRGQGRFRSNVEAVESACRLTGITDPKLLIASHIKPWRHCASAGERLDGMNGLLLTPDADHLFDRGFISFEDHGEVMVSRRVDRHDLRRLGFEKLAETRFGEAMPPAIWQTGGFAARQCGYLAYHRKEVFVS